jgi:UDP-N-acetylmuramate dehydrogenase
MQADISLRPFNTFGIDVKAAFFEQATDIPALISVLRHQQAAGLPLLVLGGGSNILLTHDFDGLVMKVANTGIEVIREDEGHAWVRAAAGVVWNDMVMYCISKGYGGIENLSLIPGNTGAAPMQNIGAYGVELKDVFHELEALNLETLESRTFSRTDCEFGYRDSIFKRALKGTCIITSVTLKLNKHPVFNTSYGAIEQELKKMNVQELSIRAISDAVISIRRSKLPDPSVLGNAGSFFKNPQIPASLFEKLKAQFPGIVAYPAAEGQIKLAAGWLIEQCGWKGKRVGETGSHKDQALVLVNYGHATGDEIWRLALSIQDSVKQNFGVIIEPEVNVV